MTQFSSNDQVNNDQFSSDFNSLIKYAIIWYYIFTVWDALDSKPIYRNNKTARKGGFLVD